MTGSFNLAAVEAALTGTRFALQIKHLTSVGSTNALALESAQTGAPDGCVYVADEQTAGRGRGGHTWHSAAGQGLYVSVLLRPHMPLADALWLSLSTGLAARTAIAAVTGITPDIRWPNDLLIGEKKCGGILVETSTTAANSGLPAMLRYAVIGVGVNVNHEKFPPELQTLATSLRCKTGNFIAREQLLIAFLLNLNEEISLLELELRGSFGGPGLLKRFAAASSWVRDKRVKVDEAGGYTGVTAGLDSRGFLQVAGDDDVLHTVVSGGVRAQ